MEVTTDNSNYSAVTGGRASGYTTNANGNIILPYYLNVDNVSNIKFRHKVFTLGNDIHVRGGTHAVEEFITKIHFIKLCPSV